MFATIMSAAHHYKLFSIALHRVEINKFEIEQLTIYTFLMFYEEMSLNNRKWEKISSLFVAIKIKFLTTSESPGIELNESASKQNDRCWSEIESRNDEEEDRRSGKRMSSSFANVQETDENIWKI